MLWLFLWLFWSPEPPPPASFESELQRGLIALNRQDLETARQSLEAASRLQPKNARVWLALAQTYLRRKDVKAATAAAQKAAILAPHEPVVQHALSIFYKELGEFGPAAEWERRFAAGPAADVNAAARAAQLSLAAGQADLAVEWAIRAKNRQDSPTMHHLLGQAYAAANQPASALGELRDAAKAAPEQEEFVSDYGQLLLRREEFAEALTLFASARQRFPASVQIELAYGVACYGQRRFSAAIDSFLKVITMDPSIEQPYLFLGRVLDQAGPRLPEITARMGAWESTMPQNYRAVFLHAKALAASGGQASDAGLEARFRRAVQLNDDFWESHFELGQLFARQRRWAEAAAELSRAAKLNPAEPAVHYHLARVYDRLSQPEKASAERSVHEQLTRAEKAAEAKRAGMSQGGQTGIK